MERNISYIHEISDAKDTWRIKVYVARLWKHTLKDKPQEVIHQDMICIDEKGNKILAVIGKIFLPKLGNLIQEGASFIITNFTVAPYQHESFKMVKQEIFINFHKNTSVRRCMEFKMDNVKLFTFLSFEDILAKNGDEEIPFDVIGEVIRKGEIEPVTKTNGSKYILIKLELMDLKGEKLNCTFWGDFARQVDVELKDWATRTGHVIMIIQFAKLSTWRNEKKSISNCLFGSKVYIDADMEEINHFRECLIERDGQAISSQRITNLSSPSDISNSSVWVDKQPRTPIDEIRGINSFTRIIVVGTIKCLQSEQSWYYLACRKCQRKVQLSNDVDMKRLSYGNPKKHPYHCKDGCKMFVSDVTPRFKVQIRVQDDTGSVSLVLMDRDVQTLLNTTASKLLDDIDQAEDFELFPEELDVLVGKKFVFLVEISKYNIDFNFHVYTIKKLTDDIETTGKFQDSPNLMQESMSESDLNFSHENSVKGKLEQKIGNSVSGENNVIDLDNSCTKKRHFDVNSSDARRIDFEKEDELVAKGSSSKMSLKVPKIEKP